MKFTMYHSCIAVFDLEKSIKFYEDAPLDKKQPQQNPGTVSL